MGNVVSFVFFANKSSFLLKQSNPSFMHPKLKQEDYANYNKKTYVQQQI